jgi:hypothetical protein
MSTPVTSILPFACQVPQTLVQACLQEADAGLTSLKAAIEATLPKPNAGLLRWALVGAAPSPTEPMLQCEGVYLAC